MANEVEFGGERVIEVGGGYEVHPGHKGGFVVVGPRGDAISTWPTEAEAVKVAEDLAGQPISISRDGVWAGDGVLRDGSIEDCPAVLGTDQDASDETYEAIADAIEDGDDRVTRPDGVYTWTIG